jgi:octaprenyl-diphosphate synthase
MAAVVELIHTASLVHDDVLDGARFRRYLETVNARWDTETSILLGDYLFTLAIELTAELGDQRVSSRVSQAGRRLCEGELRQVCERGNFSLSETEYLEIIEAKTAELYACSAELGAYFCGATEAVQSALGRFGRKLGIAFQIIDDVLDIAGDEQVAGKSLGTDILKRKPTLPVIRHLQLASGTDRAELVDRLRNPSAAMLPSLRQELLDSGSLEYARQKAREFAVSAMQELAPLPDNSGKHGLLAVAEYVVARDR